MTSAADRKTFLKQYAIIRHAEGRGSDEAAYYRGLPYADSDQWRIRAKSFDHFLRRVITPLEKTVRKPLEVLDLGAGNGWLSWRLAQHGHHPIAVDFFTDDRDGLGAIRKYAETAAVAADFDHLPFASASFDIAVYNASFHYSSDYVSTLKEVRRCLRPEGRIVILDSPVYRKAEHGETMRRERQSLFEGTYGFRSEALGSIEYLDEPSLARLARDLGIEWSRSKPWYGWKWAMRPWLARLRRRRPPSRFFLVSGRFL
jgi:SAM-dependent methyltransferase